MPELPEVETVCRGLRPVLEGRRLARVVQRSPALRWPFPAGLEDRLTGRTVTAVARRAKYILLHLDDGGVLLAHLGMSGRMVVAEDPEAPFEPHDHLVLVTDAGAQVRLNDPRRFGIVEMTSDTALAAHRLLRHLGPEPLDPAFDGPALAARLDGRRTPIKAALLDQTTVAGLGNIYVCEALFFAGISPRRQARAVQGKRAADLAAAIRRVLERAVEAGGSSLRDYRQSSGELGMFQHAWAVYGREGEACPGCTCDPALTGGIRRIVQSGRSTFYCARRQR